MKLLILTILLSFNYYSLADENSDNVEDLKKQILELAESYEEAAFLYQEGDEDLKKQKSLEPLVNELIGLKPQVPVRERLDLVTGVWRQVWGPYNYQTAERIVPNGTYVKEIYQTVFKEGYYYNVSPSAFFGRFEYVPLLRGEFDFSETNPNGLDVQFTGFRFNRVRPNDIPIWELAALAEASNLPQPFFNVVPDFIVRRFEGGTLDEIYTDETMRILYGRNDGNFKIPFIYIMEKVAEL